VLVNATKCMFPLKLQNTKKLQITNISATKYHKTTNLKNTKILQNTSLQNTKKTTKYQIAAKYPKSYNVLKIPNIYKIIKCQKI